MTANRSLIAATSNPLLEKALRDKLERRSSRTGSLGQLESIAVRLGLVQNSLKPRFHDPQIVMFAADHGIAVDGIASPPMHSTQDIVKQLLNAQLPVSVFARIQGLALTVVDAGIAEQVAPHPQLMARKIAHGTRSPRVSSAMTVEQAHSAIRAGMEIADALPGNAFVCAGFGTSADASAALVLSRLSNRPIRDLLISGPSMKHDDLAQLVAVTQAAQARHREVTDAVEVLAAFGGFEVAMMVGLMLVAASKRHLLVIDGLPACAALLAAANISPTVTDYCVFSRSHSHRGLDHILDIFEAAPLMELGLESTDGTGACLAWPLLLSAAALLTDVADGEDAGPTLPSNLSVA
ncbi:MAG: nicotinate-nucleotide--dimethylbenzimidazole phosphoribosyltransferase [Rhizobacter sp.]|nr:nicotinate-nucleotide--dimethylbenzimidazole phosphoribosyltransferase [Rhizobacter sp.]